MVITGRQACRPPGARELGADHLCVYGGGPWLVSQSAVGCVGSWALLLEQSCATHQGNWRRVLSQCKHPAPCGDQGREGRCADWVTTLPEGRMAMQVKTRVKAGGITLNHTETLVRAKGQVQGLTVKPRVKAGGNGTQSN